MGLNVHHHKAKDRSSVSIAFHFSHKINIALELCIVLVGGHKHNDSDTWTQSDQTPQGVLLDFVLLSGLQMTMILTIVRLR